MTEHLERIVTVKELQRAGVPGARPPSHRAGGAAMRAPGSRVTYAQLATAWGVSRRTVLRWIAEDRARGYQVRTVVHRVNRARRYVVVCAACAAAVQQRHQSDRVFGHSD